MARLELERRWLVVCLSKRASDRKKVRERLPKVSPNSDSALAKRLMAPGVTASCA